MAAPMVTSKITLRSGEKQEFSHQIQSNSDAITYDKLRKSIQVVQKEVNEYLTVQVDLERGLNNANKDDDTAEGEGEGDEDDEDEDEGGTDGQGQGDQEPPPKKPKK